MDSWVSLLWEVGSSLNDPLMCDLTIHRGIGNVISGPISSALLGNQHDLGSYASGKYGVLVLFTGIIMCFGSISIVGKLWKRRWPTSCSTYILLTSFAKLFTSHCYPFVWVYNLSEVCLIKLMLYTRHIVYINDNTFWISWLSYMDRQVKSARIQGKTRGGNIGLI